MKPSAAILTGMTSDHIVKTEEGVAIHAQMLSAFEKLKRRAAKDGFELRVASAFRDFSSQLRIWNLKASGQRMLVDEHGQPLDYQSLSPEQIVEAILRWSALPGGSRHHWGTEIDVFDGKAGAEVKLVPQEAEEGGPFAHFHLWLEENASEEGFFRPYQKDLGGVSPEWWHLSYAPVSQTYYEAQTVEIVRSALQPAALELKEIVLTQLEEIYVKYIRNITPPLA